MAWITTLSAIFLGTTSLAEERSVKFPIKFRPPPFKSPALPPAAKGITGSYAQPDFEHRVVELINQIRLVNYLPPLKISPILRKASKTHSSNMARRRFFGHCDPDTRDNHTDRLAAVNYWGVAAENIAVGPVNPEAVVQIWLESPGHRDNIMDGRFCEIGVGYHGGDALGQASLRYDSNGNCRTDRTYHVRHQHYWTQTLGCRYSAHPVVINLEAHTTDNPTVRLYLYGSDWARQMRIRNQPGAWSSWRPFSSILNWRLNHGSGSRTVQVELRNRSMIRQASDAIILTPPANRRAITIADSETD